MDSSRRYRHYEGAVIGFRMVVAVLPLLRENPRQHRALDGGLVRILKQVIAR